MTREQIIAAANNAGFSVAHTHWEDDIAVLERFYTIVANQTKDQCAALCYEQNWELRGEEMAEMILATKEEVK
jgi:hypothetical protein